jgi:hypothetical protein
VSPALPLASRSDAARAQSQHARFDLKYDPPLPARARAGINLASLAWSLQL